MRWVVDVHCWRLLETYDYSTLAMSTSISYRQGGQRILLPQKRVCMGTRMETVFGLGWCLKTCGNHIHNTGDAMKVFLTSLLFRCCRHLQSVVHYADENRFYYGRNLNQGLDIKTKLAHFTHCIVSKGAKIRNRYN